LSPNDEEEFFDVQHLVGGCDTYHTSSLQLYFSISRLVGFTDAADVLPIFK
jgi:hypothetical protein